MARKLNEVGLFDGTRQVRVGIYVTGSAVFFSVRSGVLR